MADIFSKERPFPEWKITGIDGAPAVLFETCESTQKYLEENFRKLADGTLIVADAQSAGHGRHSRAWKSPKGKNLYFDILIPLNGLPKEIFPQVMQVVAMTLARLLNGYNADVSVKWPNDLLWQGQKFCGMVSTVLSQGMRTSLAVGIGINVNSLPEDYKDIPRPITTLREIFGKEIDREELLRQIVSALGVAIERLRTEGIRPWMEDWRRMDKFIGCKARIVEGTEVIEGTIIDINEDGSLKFRTAAGETIRRYSGDLEI